MRFKFYKHIIVVSVSVLFTVAALNCSEEIVGTKDPVSPPSTEIFNVPSENSIENLYNPTLKVGWKGISKDALIKGYWVSWKSYYLIKKDSVIQEPYYTIAYEDTISFPSADSINKQILTVKAVDEYGNVDPVGAVRTYYTSKTVPPETEIEFPSNNSSAFFLPEVTPTWKGVRVDFSATTTFGEIKEYSFKIDDNPWSDWESSNTVYINKNNFPGISEGKHTIRAIARNNALVEDPTPAEVEINFVKPTHQKEWLIIDDTNDQNGSTERPSDEQVDNFYDSLLINVPHDSWDIAKEGMITKEKSGQYKYVLWHSDDHRKCDLPAAVGVLTDYLNTQGRVFISGWNFYSYFESDASWKDSTKYYGDFLTKYLHINGQYTVDDALLDSVIVQNSDQTRETYAVDSTKIYVFRNGLYKVNIYNDLGAFTDPVFFYHTADSTGSLNNAVIGYGYHNDQYQLVVTGFPVYYLTKAGAQKVFQVSKEYLEKNFPY